MRTIANLFSFKGNAKRARWLQFFGLALLAWLGAAWLDENVLAPNLCLVNEDWICYLPGEVREGITFDRIVALLLLIPFFAITVRRLNSHEKSPFLALLAVPLIAILAAFLYWPAVTIKAWQLIGAAIIAVPLFYLMLAPKSEKPSD